MESPEVSEECKAELLWQGAGYNLIELNRRLNETVGQRLESNEEKSMVKKPPVRRMAGPSRPDFGWVFVVGRAARFD
jgi:hypothetical protein